MRATLGLPDSGELSALVRARVERGPVDARVIDEVVAHLRELEVEALRDASWATGSGEGLAAIDALLDARLARAWLLADVAPDDARSLLDAIEGGVHHVRESLRPHLAALRDRLDRQGRAT